MRTLLLRARGCVKNLFQIKIKIADTSGNLGARDF